MATKHYYFQTSEKNVILGDEMPKKAYSYIRFSREHQSEGDSLRRQIDSTRAYCEKNNLLLDESLNLHDLGVSAYEGRNASTGSLGRFIELCQAKLIPPGSALVVESLDRISRQSPRLTVSLLTTLLDVCGVEVHLTQAGKVFRPSKKGDNGSQEGVDLIMAVALAMRAHEESEIKSQRLREAFQRKRIAAAEGKTFVSKSLPWWLTFKDGKIIAIPERASVVKRIFKLTADGWSSQKIARQLNAEGVPTWRPNTKEWTDSRVRDTIRFESPLGHLTPTPKTRAAGGVASTYKLKNYYPQIVSEVLAANARARMKENLTGVKGRDPMSGRPINIFRGILRHKGRWCRFQTHRNGSPNPKTGLKAWHGYYDDHDPNNGGKKSCCISSTQLEPLVLSCLRELSASDLKPVALQTLSKSEVLRRQVNELDRKVANLVAAVASGSRAVLVELRRLETELHVRRQESARAEAEESAGTVPVDTHLKSITLNVLNPATRLRTATAIRRLIRRIDVGRKFDDLPIDEKLCAILSKKLADEQKGKIPAGHEQTHSYPDPVPDNKRRHPLYILVTFISGAKRLIMRPEGLKSGRVILMRVEADPITDG